MRGDVSRGEEEGRSATRRGVNLLRTADVCETPGSRTFSLDLPSLGLSMEDPAGPDSLPLEGREVVSLTLQQILPPFFF